MYNCTNKVARELSSKYIYTFYHILCARIAQAAIFCSFFPNMERSMRATSHISQFIFVQAYKQEISMQSNDRQFPTYHYIKWLDVHHSGAITLPLGNPRTVDCKALVTFATQALEKGQLLVKEGFGNGLVIDDS